MKKIFDSRLSQILGHYSTYYSTPNICRISNIFRIARRSGVIFRSLLKSICFILLNIGWLSDMIKCRRFIEYSGDLKSDHSKSGFFGGLISNILVFKWSGYGFSRRMLKAPPLYSSDLHLSVIKCNCRTYEKNELFYFGGVYVKLGCQPH